MHRRENLTGTGPDYDDSIQCFRPDDERIPFDVALDIPNETTVAAMKEAERLLEDRKK